MAKKANRQTRGASARQQQLPLVWGEGRIDPEEGAAAVRRRDAPQEEAPPREAAEDAAASCAVEDCAAGSPAPGPAGPQSPPVPSAITEGPEKDGDLEAAGESGGSGQSGVVIRLSSGDLSFCDTMVEARGAANLTIRQTSEKTKVPIEFIESIETEAWEQVPDNFYTRTYVRRLCKAYGIDAEPIISSLDAELAEHGQGDGAPGLAVTVGQGTSGATIFHLPELEGEPEADTGLSAARWIVSLSLVLLILLVAAGLGVQWWRSGRPGSSGDRPAAAEQTQALDLEQFLPPQQLPLKELPVPHGPRR